MTEQKHALTFGAVHLLAVEASKGLGSTRQKHQSCGSGFSAPLLAHGSSQTTVYQRLQHLHYSTHKPTETPASLTALH